MARSCRPNSTLILAILLAPVAVGSVVPRAAIADPEPELSPEVRAVIARGIAFLADRQRKKGTLRGSWEANESILAITGLAGLALLASGSTPTSGPYAENVREAVDFVLRCRARSGLLVSPGGPDRSAMHAHGFAALFLAEAYGTGLDAARETEVREALRDAIDLMARTQSKDGGWYYHAVRGEDEGSVTITQIQAMRAARNAGIKVEKRVIDDAIEYIRRSQDADGGVRYTVRSGRSTPALTAAGLAVLHGAGDYDSENVHRAIGYLRKHLRFDPASDGYFHYTHFYAAQAMFQHGGADWAQYFPRVRAALLRDASDDRVRFCAWRSAYGEAYATALSLLILQIPYRYLPIYER